MADARALSPQEFEQAYIEIEQAYLGGLLVNPDALAVAAVTPDTFDQEYHAAIYEAIVAIRASGIRPSPMTVRTAVSSHPMYAEVGGYNYILNLFADATTATPSGLRDIATALRDAEAKRRLAKSFDGMAGDLRKSGVDVSPDAIAAYAVTAIQQSLGSRHGGSKTEGAGDTAARVTAALDHPDRRATLPMGLPALDAVTGGMLPGEVWIVAGRPGMGKSTFASQVATNIAASGLGALLITPEMTTDQVMTRILSERCAALGHVIPYRWIRSRDIDQYQREIIDRAEAEVKALPLWLDGTPRPTFDVVETISRSAFRVMDSRRIKPGVIIIDHLHKLAPDPAYKGNKHGEYSDLSSRIAGLAKDLNVPVILCAQLNRGLEARDDKRPILSDLRESGTIEEDAHGVLMLYRPAYYLGRKKPEVADPKHADWKKECDRLKSKLDVVVEKNRDGETGLIELECDVGCSKVRG